MEIDAAIVSQIVLMGHELDRAEAELRGVIDRLDIDTQAELVALMWIGRGSFDAAEWSDALETATNEATTPCADYLIGTPHFPDHLEAGAEAMGMTLDQGAGVML